MRLLSMLPLMLLDPTASTEGTAKVDPPAATGSADPSEGFKLALKKHGDDANALARESWTAAEKFRAERDDLQAKLPKAGALVLEGADLDEYQSFRKLGPYADIKATLDKLPTLEGEVNGFKRARLIGDAARAHGHDGKPLGYDAEVLATLAGPGLRIEIKEAKVGGKDVRVAEVVETASDDKGVEVEKRTPLDKFAATAWAKFLPSLKGTPAPTTGTGPARQVVPTPDTTPADKPAPKRLPGF